MADFEQFIPCQQRYNTSTARTMAISASSSVLDVEDDEDDGDDPPRGETGLP
jgi:hypothetical protein